MKKHFLESKEKSHLRKIAENLGFLKMHKAPKDVIVKKLMTFSLSQLRKADK